jgi:PUA domain protein
MIKRFDESNISGVTQLKSTVQKGIKAKLVEQFPNITNFMDEIMPKKEAIRTVKWFVTYF